MKRSVIVSHVEEWSMQPCGGVEYATMWRSEVCSHAEEWSIKPCGGVEYTKMWRSGIFATM